jgi:hypothetical protein
MIETRLNIIESASVLHAVASDLQEVDPENADEIIKKFEDSSPSQRAGSPSND